MIDFALARRMMVDGQVRTSDVTDLRIIAAMLELPRERFVSAADTDLAYLDTDVPAVGAAAGEQVRHLLKPMVLAKLVQAAAVKAEDRVLDVGCATGYSAALLARLARSVAALEQDPVLARLARENLAAVGAGNVDGRDRRLDGRLATRCPLRRGVRQWCNREHARTLCGQLKDGGRLVAVVGRAPVSRAMLYCSVQGDVSGRPIFDAAAPLLPGFAAPPAFVF